MGLLIYSLVLSCSVMGIEVKALQLSYISGGLVSFPHRLLS
jgi:hypothetical protein